jgi:hypothetical protein
LPKDTDSDAGDLINEGQEEEASKSNIYKILSNKYDGLDAKAKGLFFFVFLGGLALVMVTYFIVIISIVHILCPS